MPRTPEPWEVSKDDALYGRFTIDGVAHEETERIDEGYDISVEEGDQRAREAEERDEGNRRLIQAAPGLLKLVEQAFERFTDNDFQPPDKALKDWQDRAKEILGGLKPCR